jgi:hypothetical protein
MDKNSSSELITCSLQMAMYMWMKIFFVDFCFLTKDHVICDYGCMQFVKCN